MTIRYSPALLKKLRKVNVRVRKSFKNRLLIFSKDPNYPLLNNHPLEREYQGFRSIDITANWRALYTEKEEGQEPVAYFELLGTHKELYVKTTESEIS